MAWAKLHTDILGDPKLMRAARKGAKGLDLLPWLIAFAKQANDDGYLSVGGEPADAEDIAELIPGATKKRVRECLDSLVSIGVLERIQEDSAKKCGIFLVFSRWELRSGTKPSDDPDRIRTRVTAFRQRNSKKDNEGETPRNALHPQSSNATEEKREEKKRTEKEKKPHSAREGAPTWITPFAQVWRTRYGGPMPIGPFVRPLRGLLTSPDEQPEVLKRWGNYLASTEGRYANAERFAATYGEWAEARPPTLNGNGARRVGGVTNRSFENAMRALEHEP